LREFFGEKALFKGRTPVFDKPLYLLAFVNRSGSNLLAEYLRMTPALRGFHEQLIHETVTTYCTRNRIEDFPTYIQTLSGPATQDGQAYGFKASWDQILMLYRFGIFAMYPEVRVIHIHRKDILGQAISYHIALQTKQWTSLQTPQNDRTCMFDGPGLSGIIGSILSGNQWIGQVATILDLPIRDVCYEDLVDRPLETVRDLAEFTGQDLARWTGAEPRIRKQASGLNESFRAQYITYARDALLNVG
jgi:LPS sulfotransferase NodH